MFAVAKLAGEKNKTFCQFEQEKKKKSHKEHRNPPQKDLDSTQNKWAINKKNNL